MSVFNQTYNPPSSCFGFCNAEETVGNPSVFNRGPILPEDRLAADDRRKKKELDDLLSEALSDLTFEERQQQQEILHGVAKVATEEQSFLDGALEDLDLNLKLIKRGSSYEVAERKSPDYVHARDFRVMFLRANDYDPKASADQMIRFFKMKHELFGVEKLGKDITMDDLDESDIECLKIGWLQFLGSDRSGRGVLLYVGGLFGESSSCLQNDLRVQYFVVMQALKSEETQLNGTISLWYAMGDNRAKKNGSKRYFEVYMATKVFPRKKAAIHFLIDEMRQPFVASAIIKIMKDRLRARLRIHFGSAIECQYQLSTYGIPSYLMPLGSDGKLNLTPHLQWVCSHQQVDASTNHSASLKVAKEANGSTSSSKDVFFTGGRVSFSEGNQYFLALVRDYSQVYDSANLKSKQDIVEEIVGKIHQRGGRFLRRPKGSTAAWEEVPLVELRKKVTQSFRNRRRRRNASQERKPIEAVPPTVPDCNIMPDLDDLFNDCTRTGATHHVQIDVDPRIPSAKAKDCHDITPNQNDVIFTGKKNPYHDGNQRFHSLVQGFSQVYDVGSAESKRGVVNEIIRKIHEAGGRFLKQDETGGWKEVSTGEIRKKTMQAFRNRRRRQDSSKQKASSSFVGPLIAGEPLPNDVIFGITKTLRYPGSHLLDHVIKENLDAYESFNSGEKVRLVEMIMQITIDKGGRFLQPSGSEPGRWMEVSYDIARDQITKYFYNFCRQRTTKGSSLYP